MAVSYPMKLKGVGGNIPTRRLWGLEAFYYRFSELSQKIFQELEEFDRRVQGRIFFVIYRQFWKFLKLVGFSEEQGEVVQIGEIRNRGYGVFVRSRDISLFTPKELQDLWDVCCELDEWVREKF